VPTGVVNTQRLPRHSEPAAARSLSCCSLWSSRACTSWAGSGTVRRDRAVMGAVKTRPPPRWRCKARRTRRTRAGRSTSSHHKPSASPCRSPSARPTTRRRCAAPGPALLAPGSALWGARPARPRRTSHCGWRHLSSRLICQAVWVPVGEPSFSLPIVPLPAAASRAPAASLRDRRPADPGHSTRSHGDLAPARRTGKIRTTKENHRRSARGRQRGGRAGLSGTLATGGAGRSNLWPALASLIYGR
jgi:hypothetical protein